MPMVLRTKCRQTQMWACRIAEFASHLSYIHTLTVDARDLIISKMVDDKLVRNSLFENFDFRSFAEAGL